MKPILVSQSKPSDVVKKTPSGVILADDSFKSVPVIEQQQENSPQPVDPAASLAAKSAPIPQVSITPTSQDSDASYDEDFMKDFEDVSLDELIVSGYVTHTATINEKLVVEMRTLKKIENMRVDKNAMNYQGSNVYVLNEVSLDALSISVQSVNGKAIGDKLQDKKKYLANLAEVIIQAIWDEYRKLNKATAILLMGSSKNSLTRRLVGPEQA